MDKWRNWWIERLGLGSPAQPAPLGGLAPQGQQLGGPAQQGLGTVPAGLSMPQAGAFSSAPLAGLSMGTPLQLQLGAPAQQAQGSGVKRGTRNLDMTRQVLRILLKVRKCKRVGALRMRDGSACWYF